MGHLLGSRFAMAALGRYSLCPPVAVGKIARCPWLSTSARCCLSACCCALHAHAACKLVTPIDLSSGALFHALSCGLSRAGGSAHCASVIHWTTRLPAAWATGAKPPPVSRLRHAVYQLGSGALWPRRCSWRWGSSCRAWAPGLTVLQCWCASLGLRLRLLWGVHLIGGVVLISYLHAHVDMHMAGSWE